MVGRYAIIGSMSLARHGQGKDGIARDACCLSQSGIPPLSLRLRLRRIFISRCPGKLPISGESVVACVEARLTEHVQPSSESEHRRAHAASRPVGTDKGVRKPRLASTPRPTAKPCRVRSSTGEQTPHVWICCALIRPLQRQTSLVRTSTRSTYDVEPWSNWSHTAGERRKAKQREEFSCPPRLQLEAGGLRHGRRWTSRLLARTHTHTHTQPIEIIVAWADFFRRGVGRKEAEAEADKRTAYCRCPLHDNLIARQGIGLGSVR